MTRDDVIRMARKAGGDDWGIFRDFMPEIECFANLVAAAEREACAEMVSNWKPEFWEYMTQEYAAQYIRARGQG